MRITGDGLAACCAARLLSARGLLVSVERTSRPKPARLLISTQTQSLLRDIFSARAFPSPAPEIRRRIVCWGCDASAAEFPHRGTVVAEQSLLDRLWQMHPLPPVSPDAAQADWTILSAPSPMSSAAAKGFGRRLATTALVDLAVTAPHDACCIESVPDGWLFLLPAGEGRASLISCGYEPEQLIGQSRWIADLICNCHSSQNKFAAFPQLREALFGSAWLACGSAAMTFDPLCGEGAGHAAREALLASAVICAAVRGDAHKLYAHYEARLRQGFLRHLQACLPFYRSGGCSDFWKEEAAALAQGIEQLQQQLRGQPALQYRFAGFDLEPVAAV